MVQKNLHKAFTDYERGNTQEISRWHIYHCLDILRQDLMCTADDTPMPGVELPHEVGEGQVRLCRSWNKLTEWTKEPERQACYHRITDFGGVVNKLERYAFCPEDSQYFPVQQAYFDKWGHRDPFGISR